MGSKSAGILLYRIKEGKLEVFLVHPGGPYWRKKDLGAWSIPKGEFDDQEGSSGETDLEAAIREFQEETGFSLAGDFMPLGSQKQKGGKTVFAWALEFDLDPAEIQSNSFDLEWPPRSGKTQTFPEIDRAGWFSVEAALEMINPGQAGFIHELAGRLGRGSGTVAIVNGF